MLQRRWRFLLTTGGAVIRIARCFTAFGEPFTVFIREKTCEPYGVLSPDSLNGRGDYSILPANWC
ncbi:hypothetical protein DBY68_016130 [Pseudocitrobacter sp. RIT415]|nr:hypothetical protein DBY68_016130 [Pseudocitrobacter sp. RIT 415]